MAMEQPPLQSLYQQLILEHYRRPRNKGELAEKTVEVHMANPVCGDEIRLQLRVEGDEIADALQEALRRTGALAAPAPDATPHAAVAAAPSVSSPPAAPTGGGEPRPGGSS